MIFLLVAALSPNMIGCLSPSHLTDSYDPILISLVEFVSNKIGKICVWFVFLLNLGIPRAHWWWQLLHRNFVHICHLSPFLLQFLLFPTSFYIFTLLCQNPFFFSSSIISNHFFYFLSCYSLPLCSFWLPSAGKRERNQVRLLFFVIFILSFDFLFFRKNKALASDFPHISACAHEVRFPFPALFRFFIEDCFLRLSDIHW